MNILENLKKLSFLFVYYCCETSSVSPIALDPDLDPELFSESRYLKHLFHRILKISTRSRYRAPDPFFLVKTGSSSLLLMNRTEYLGLHALKWNYRRNFSNNTFKLESEQ